MRSTMIDMKRMAEDAKSRAMEASIDFLVARLEGCMLSSPRCLPLPLLAEPLDSNQPMFSPQWVHILGKVLWFYPLYIFSLIISALWYGDIDKFGFAAVEEPGSMSDGHSSQRECIVSIVSDLKGKPADLGRSKLLSSAARN